MLKGEKTLSLLRKLDCEICSRDIYTFYDNAMDILEQNELLLNFASGHNLGVKSLGQGRLVILRDRVRGHSKAEAAS